MTKKERQLCMDDLRLESISLGRLLRMIPDQLCYHIRKDDDFRMFYPTLKYLYGYIKTHGTWGMHYKLYWECEDSESMGEYNAELLVLPGDIFGFCGSGASKIKALKEVIVVMLEYFLNNSPKTFDSLVAGEKASYIIGAPLSVWGEKRSTQIKKLKR